MTHHLEELQAKKYLEHLISVDAAKWQWFSNKQCFEVGDATARPRVYFDIDEQYETYVLSIYLEVDRVIVGSNTLRIGKQRPADHDELLADIIAVDQPSLLVVLMVRLLRHRHAMSTAARPDHLRIRIENYATIMKRKITVDWPHNVQERLMMLRIERNASRVRPRSRRI